MYAAGHAIRPTQSSCRALAWRHSGRWAMVLMVLMVASFALARVAIGETHPETTVVVQPGDTLWSIAAAQYPSEDVRGRVEEIESLNGLQGPLIEVGESLRLPA
jgi:nucleoid-associated protein YgaU